MFAVYCPGHQARVLLGPRSVLALRNTSEGVVVHWRCRCGATGAEPFGSAPIAVDLPRTDVLASPVEPAA